MLAPDEITYFKNNNSVAKILSHLKVVQEQLISKPWVLMDRPVLDPLKLAEAVGKKLKEREDMLNICQASLVRKMQERTGEIIERPGWRLANDAEVRGGCIASDCPEVAPFVCSMEACKAYCCSVHGPDHHLHVVWATAEALTIQRDQRKAAVAIINPVGRGRGSRGVRGGRREQGSVDAGRSAGEGSTRGRSRGRGGTRGSNRGRGRDRGHFDNEPVINNGGEHIHESIPSREANPMSILADLLRSHPNLLSQLNSMGSTGTIEENSLDEWIL